MISVMSKTTEFPTRRGFSARHHFQILDCSVAKYNVNAGMNGIDTVRHRGCGGWELNEGAASAPEFVICMHLPG